MWPSPKGLTICIIANTALFLSAQGKELRHRNLIIGDIIDDIVDPIVDIIDGVSCFVVGLLSSDDALVALIEADAEVSTAALCLEACSKEADCNFWSFYKNPADEDDYCCKLFSTVVSLDISVTLSLSGSKSCAATPEPTMNPVVEKEDCYMTSYKVDADATLEVYSDDSSACTVEQCHAKCVAHASCRYWTFRDDSPSTLCKLYDAINGFKEKSSAFTTGPKVCTDAPTPSPTNAPTNDPTNASVEDTPVPTHSPTSEDEEEEEDDDDELVNACQAARVEYKGGKTIKSLSDIISSLACAEACLDYEECMGWTWKSDGKCWLLKKNFKAKNGRSGYFSGPRECPKDVACEVQFAEYTGGKDIARIKDVESAAECAAKCIINGDCETWTWRSDKELCTLRKDTKASSKSRHAYFFTGTKEDCAEYELPSTGPTPAPTLSPLTDGDNCDYPINDVLFILDGSGSTDSKEWRDMRRFVRQLSTSFDVSSSTTRLGAVRFSTEIDIDWTFDDDRALDWDLFQSSVGALTADGAGSATGGGLIAAQDIFDDSSIREGTHKRVAILISSGKPNKITDCKDAGYRKNAKKCAKEAGLDLRKGADGIEGTEDDVFLIHVRVGKVVPRSLFGRKEDLFVQLNEDDVAASASLVIGEICT